jgi:hypothetical protein
VGPCIANKSQDGKTLLGESAPSLVVSGIPAFTAHLHVQLVKIAFLVPVPGS